MHVLLDDDLGRLTVRPVSPWHRLLARILAVRLDHQLASGTPPETDAILAARAMFLTSARYRRVLARSLRRMLAASTVPSVRPRTVAAAKSAEATFRPRVPLRRDRIARSAPGLAELANCLTAPRPVPARGVALVSQLLTDGCGPLYRAAAQEDLGGLIDQASQALAS
jgi:hypothetical protein